MKINNLYEKMQSAYQKEHSTETALLHVQNDILQAVDDNCAVILVLLDLSAAFDTVDHQVLPLRLETRIGIKDKALSWFRSYLMNRTQYVCIQGVKSSGKRLNCGVPQGSVLGPDLFSIYTLPVGDIVRKYGLCHMFYADDGQLYIVFRPTRGGTEIAKSVIETCICEVRAWMAENFLMFNDGKTVFTLIDHDSKRLPH